VTEKLDFSYETTVCATAPTRGDLAGIPAFVCFIIESVITDGQGAVGRGQDIRLLQRTLQPLMALRQVRYDRG
jgi:hypothetical protein